MAADAHNTLALAPWWQQALVDPQMLQSAALGAGCVLAAAALLWRLRAAHRHQRRPGAEAGTATVEFTLVFPILMFIILLLVQVTWAMVGNLFVHYAAFSATRSAIVYIPYHAPHNGEPRNTIRLNDNAWKFSHIRRAAAGALIPVAGQSDTGKVNADGVVEGLKAFYQKSGPNVPGWVTNQAAGRVRYAVAYTDVHLMRTNTLGQRVSFQRIEGGSAEFNTREPITVRVVHQLNLAVPYVSVIFSDGKHEAGGEDAPFSYVTAHYTLTNEGVSDALPDPPPLPRNP